MKLFATSLKWISAFGSKYKWALPIYILFGRYGVLCLCLWIITNSIFNSLPNAYRLGRDLLSLFPRLSSIVVIIVHQPIIGGIMKFSILIFILLSSSLVHAQQDPTQALFDQLQRQNQEPTAYGQESKDAYYRAMRPQPVIRCVNHYNAATGNWEQLCQ